MEEKFSEPCDLYYKVFTHEEDAAYQYRFLSPFEFKNTLLSEARKTSSKSLPLINTGRGNPNFFSALPRKAFALLTNLCVDLGLSSDEQEVGFMPEKDGLAAIFYKRLRKIGSSAEAKFLKKAIPKMQSITKMKRDDFVHDLVISTIGCFYPSPPRIQRFAEPVLTKFIEKVIIKPAKPYITNERETNKEGISMAKMTTNLFLTEGATAAIVYVFNSLKYNKLLNPGDKIGIITPIFSPYLEIPYLSNYDLQVICVKSNMENDWEISQEDIEKLGDKSIKALFLVNPTNPVSLSLSVSTVSKIKKVVKKSNPDLIILSDIVYAPFVDEFNTLTNALPKNCITVYSFSKYFGVTGWRLGSILMSKNNIIDSRLLKKVPSEVNDRYKMITTEPAKIKFIDRLLMDSRQVAEAHTAGLSTPQQVLMTLFAMYDYMDTKRIYNEKLKTLLLDRIECLTQILDYPLEETPLSANYYIVIDLLKVARNFDPDLADHLSQEHDPLEFILRLAKEYATVVLPGVGFGAPFWTIRISMANTDEIDYALTAQNIKDLMSEYSEEFSRYKKTGKKSGKVKVERVENKDLKNI